MCSSCFYKQECLRWRCPPLLGGLALLVDEFCEAALANPGFGPGSASCAATRPTTATTTGQDLWSFLMGLDNWNGFSRYHHPFASLSIV